MELPSEPWSDLSWLAFAYVSGELFDDAAVAFERRLAQDQSAREAVAEAVALVGAVAALPPETLPISRRTGFRPWLAVGAAAAACLALVIGLSRRGPMPVVPAVAPAQAGLDPAEKVALAWSGLRQELDAEPDASDDLVAWLEEPELVADEPESVADHGLPGWLVEAAALGERASGPKEN
jgi:hypothetical protein